MGAGIEMTKMMKELEKFRETDPEWIAEALKVISTWERNEHLHIVAVALGLKQAYLNGVAGKYPTSQGTKRVARTRHTEKPGRVSRTRK